MSRWSIAAEGAASRPSAGARAGAEQRVDLGALYDAFGNSLYRYLLTLLGNADEAEDALQEVFLGLLRRPRHKPIEGLRAYLFRAARNQALTILRRRRRDEAVPGVSWVDPESLGFRDRELALDADRALRALSRGQREVLMLKLSEGLTFRETAAVLGIPQNTAASRYRLAVARLRALLGADEDDR